MALHAVEVGLLRLFALFNLAFGVAIGVLQQHWILFSITPALLDAASITDVDDPKLFLYATVFGLFAALLGVARMVGSFQLDDAGTRQVLVASFVLEFIRDAAMYNRGLIGPSEAVALVPSALFALRMALYGAPSKATHAHSS